jgi:hypothetical protein
MKELQGMEVSVKRDMTVFRRLNAVSIEGVTYAEISGVSVSSYQKI